MSKSFGDERCKLWDQLLSAQVSVFYEAELQYLSSLHEWRDAMSIADIGCGNGDYIAKLKDSFPNKKYRGVDCSAELVAIAKEKHTDDALSFCCCDITQRVPLRKFDSAVLRFVVQHLEKPDIFFEALRQRLNPNGFALVIEPKFEACTADPDLVEFRKLVTAYDALAQSVGAARAQIQDPQKLNQLMSAHWKIERVDTICARHDRQNWNDCDLLQVFTGWINAIEATGKLEWDYASVKSEVANWIEFDGKQIDFVLSATKLTASSHN